MYSMVYVAVGNKTLEEITSEEVIRRVLVPIGTQSIMIREVLPGLTGNSYFAALKEDEVPDRAVAYVLGEVKIKKGILGRCREVYVPVQFYKGKN